MTAPQAAQEYIDYQKMYHLLFNEITNALDALEAHSYIAAKIILQQAQIQAEAIYLEAENADNC